MLTATCFLKFRCDGYGNMFTSNRVKLLDTRWTEF